MANISEFAYKMLSTSTPSGTSSITPNSSEDILGIGQYEKTIAAIDAKLASNQYSPVSPSEISLREGADPYARAKEENAVSRTLIETAFTTGKNEALKKVEDNLRQQLQLPPNADLADITEDQIAPTQDYMKAYGFQSLQGIEPKDDEFLLQSNNEEESLEKDEVKAHALSKIHAVVAMRKEINDEKERQLHNFDDTALKKFTHPDFFKFKKYEDTLRQSLTATEKYKAVSASDTSFLQELRSDKLNVAMERNKDTRKKLETAFDKPKKILDDIETKLKTNLGIQPNQDLSTAHIKNPLEPYNLENQFDETNREYAKSQIDDLNLRRKQLSDIKEKQLRAFDDAASENLYKDTLQQSLAAAEQCKAVSPSNIRVPGKKESFDALDMAMKRNIEIRKELEATLDKPKKILADIETKLKKDLNIGPEQHLETINAGVLTPSESYKVGYNLEGKSEDSIKAHAQEQINTLVEVKEALSAIRKEKLQAFDAAVKENFNNNDFLGFSIYDDKMGQLLNAAEKYKAVSASDIGFWERESLDKFDVAAARNRLSRERLEATFKEPKKILDDIEARLRKDFNINPEQQNLAEINARDLNPSESYKLACGLRDQSDGTVQAHAKQEIDKLLRKRNDLTATIETQKTAQLGAFDAAVRKEHEREAQFILDSKLLGLKSAKNKDALTEHPEFNRGHIGKTQFQIQYDKAGKVSSISILPREGAPEERMDLVLGHKLRDALFYGKGLNFFGHDKKVIDLAMQILKEQGCKDVTVVARDASGRTTNTDLSDYAAEAAARKGLEVAARTRTNRLTGEEETLAEAYKTPQTENLLKEAKQREEKADQQVRRRPG
ncbi:MAG: hypothetical protein JSS53_06605 [Proteobacteria bacterium]|nr:hypothetical protein [Pseudomonadota bacterium]